MNNFFVNRIPKWKINPNKISKIRLKNKNQNPEKDHAKRRRNVPNKVLNLIQDRKRKAKKTKNQRKTVTNPVPVKKIVKKTRTNNRNKDRNKNRRKTMKNRNHGNGHRQKNNKIN